LRGAIRHVLFGGNMRRFGSFLAFASCCSLPAFATISFVSSPFAGNDSASWSQLGANGTGLGATFNATSVLANPIVGTLAAAGGEVCVVDAASLCSWPDSGTATSGDFQSGDSLVWTNNNGPISLAFNAVFDAGLWIQLNEPGTYTVQIQAFHNLTSLGIGTSVSDGSGDPVFAGIVDSLQEVTRITLSITACGSCLNMGDFAIDRLSLLEPSAGVPEPSSWLLIATGILGIGLLNRKNLKRSTSKMKPAAIAMVVVATIVVPSAFGQDDGPTPIPFGTQLTVLSDPSRDLTAANANSSTASIGLVGPPALPIWTHNFTSNIPGDAAGPYFISMVGSGSPFNRALFPSSVNIVLVPLILNFNYGGATGTITFDPTAADDGCLGAGNTALSLTQASPIFNPIYTFTMNGVVTGTNTTYMDAFNRAQFWSLVSRGGSSFSLGFNVTTAAAQTVNLAAANVNGSNAAVFNLSGTQCGTNAGSTNRHATIGVVNINTLDPSILRGIIASLGLNASQLPFFVIYNSVMSIGPAFVGTGLGSCCVLGFHESFTGSVANPGQTYSISEFEGRLNTVFSGVGDVSVMAHEVGEWMADPSGSNATPRWGNIGQVGTCPTSSTGGQTNLEVGDPLSGVSPPVTAANASIPFTFHMQELAFASWFYSSPSLGSGGKYSSNGTFGGTAKACPPGGTN